MNHVIGNSRLMCFVHRVPLELAFPIIYKDLCWTHLGLRLFLWSHGDWQQLTHWGRLTHICVGKLIIIGSDNGLLPDQCQAIITTNAGLLLIGPLWTYFSENLIKTQQFSLKKMHMQISSVKWRPSCLGLNVLRSVNREINPVLHMSLGGMHYGRSTHTQFSPPTIAWSAILSQFSSDQEPHWQFSPNAHLYN